MLIASCVSYILFKIFHYFRLHKMALYCLANSYALTVNNDRARKVALYCKTYFSNERDCKKCILWTCAGKEIDNKQS